MSRTNIDLDDDLVAEAMRRFDLPTKKSAVEFALRRLLANRVDADFIRSLEGIGWDGDLDAMRAADAVDEW
jgi:Arc/MetJ family transcription regulator